MAKILSARRVIVGEDTPVYRFLPHPEKPTIGAWCFFDHAGPVQFQPEDGLHVGAHPHIGLQTFTWMIEGEVIHRDSLNNEEIVRAGEINIMTAGDGIAHTEDSVRAGDVLHAAQLWIALPEAQRFRQPDFAHHADLPHLNRNGFDMTVLVGQWQGHSAPTQVYTPMVGVDIKTQGGETVLPLQAGFEYAAIVLKGELMLNGECLVPGKMWVSDTETAMRLAASGEAHLLILGGEPFEPIFLWNNFVARHRDEVQAALDDWHQQTGRFGPVRAGSLAAPLNIPKTAPEVAAPAPLAGVKP